MDAETKGYNEGYADGRAYYTNDISLEIARLKRGIYAVRTYAKTYREETIEELEDSLRVLEIVLEKSKDKKLLKPLGEDE